MSKKTKKHISRNNNSNRLTRYRGGSNSESKSIKDKLKNTIKETTSVTDLATGTVGLAAQGTGALVKGVAKYTGAKAIGEGAVGLGKGAIGAVDSGMNYVSKEVQESAVKGAEEIGKFKQSVKDFASSEKTKEITGKVFDTLTGERLIKNEAKAIADTASKAASEISDKTKKAIDKLEKVTSVVGIDKSSVGNFMVEDENCKFDIPSPSKGQIENKTETNVKDKLNKSELFGDDEKFKKFMTERILKKCREYHDVTKKKPDKYFMRFFNHCANFFDCFNDVTELVYLFNDVIGSDLSFLTDIKNEKSEKDKKKEVDLKVDEKKKEIENFTKQQEKRLEEEKKIGESEEETKQRQAKEGKKKAEMDKYIKAKEAKMEELEQNKINLRKQIRNMTTVLSKLTEKKVKDLNAEQNTRLEKVYDKLRHKEDIEDIHLKSINYVLDRNRSSYKTIKSTYKGQETKLNNEIKKLIDNKVLPDIKSRLEKDLDDIYSEYQKALENTENKKDSTLVDFLKYKSEYIKKNKFLIKYGYAQAEEDKLRKKPENKLNNFIDELKKALGENQTDVNKLKKFIDQKTPNTSFVLSEDKIEDFKLSDSGKDKDTASIGKVLNEKSKKLKDLQKEKEKIDKIVESGKKEEVEYEDEDGNKEPKPPEAIQTLLEGRIEKLKEELKEGGEDYKSSASTQDSVGVDLKINILVFFLNNVFIANVKEYAIVNSSKEFTFKDDLSRELSKIIEYNKFKEDIEKLDRDKEFKKKVAKIGDTNFIDNNMFETIKIEKRDKVEQPAFDMNELYKKLKNDKDVRKNIYDYYKMLMQLEIDIDSGKVKMDEKFEQDKFGPNMYMYIVLGFLGTALGFELANLSNVRAAMGNN